MKFRFKPPARREFLESVAFYEERRAGLGADLITEFETAIAAAAQHPQACRQVHASGVRRMTLRRFPYTAYFLVLPDGVLEIAAFSHHRRRPGYWLGRLGDSH